MVEKWGQTFGERRLILQKGTSTGEYFDLFPVLKTSLGKTLVSIPTSNFYV